MGIIFLQFLQLGTTQPSPERFKKLNTWTFIEILCGGAHVLAACAGKLLIEYVRTAPNIAVIFTKPLPAPRFRDL